MPRTLLRPDDLDGFPSEAPQASLWSLWLSLSLRPAPISGVDCVPRSNPLRILYVFYTVTNRYCFRIGYGGDDGYQAL